MVTLYIVIPCYNEHAVLPETAKRLSAKFTQLLGLRLINEGSRIVFVDDGSKDDTWSIISTLHAETPYFSGLKLSRNRGHQNALLAGLMSVKNLADVVISMDADLQDDIDAIDEFLKRYEEGCGIVYGVRSDRTADTFFKRFTAEGFYRFLKLMGVEVVFNHADYRLMSRQALESLSEFSEVNLFLRGVIPLIGYKTGVVVYERKVRYAGESKYPIGKMLALAFESITSFSVKPIRLISIVGVGVFFCSIAILSYFVLGYFFGRTIVGWASLAVSIWALGGMQLLAIGTVGEYVMKTYLETKRRPRYIIDCFLNS